MTLLYTGIYDQGDAAPALKAGADRVYMRLLDGLDLPPAIVVPDCLWALEFKSQNDPRLRSPCLKQLDNVIGIVSAPDQELAACLAANGLKIILLAPAADRLLKAYEPGLLEEFISFCRSQSMTLGLGGHIEPPDIPRLLLVEPDFLVFPSDPGLQAKASSSLDVTAITLARDLIASFGARPNPAPHFAGEGELLKMSQSRKNSSFACLESFETDRVFVHDLILPASIGAYTAEINAPQRIRVNVDLSIRRQISRGHDMRDIFSYDLIVDTIKLILSRGHVQFIESFAEETASAMLAHPRVASAKVRVEKLDILNASVGIEIYRERLSESAGVTPLFSEPEIKMSGSS